MRRVDWAELPDWHVRRGGGDSIVRQIHGQLRATILSGRLRPGLRLPATRALARRLGVARASVVAAYADLLAEGYAAGRPGSGTFVAAALAPPERPARALPARPATLAALPEHARVFEALLPPRPPVPAAPFATGRCSVDERALTAWRQISARVLREMSPVHLGYSDPRGLPALRAAVCDFLRAARSVRCEPDQVVITSGTQQAIDLAIRVLLRPGEAVWTEDPGYLLTHGTLVAAGMAVCPVPVDAEGLDVAAGARRAPRARLAYVTPSHQYPLGVVLSMSRRLALLEWARRNGAWIVEDDYDSVFRYAGRPLAALQGLGEDGRVVYVGSLNKLLFPGLRMGYAVVPRAVLPAYVNLRNLVDRHPASFNQAVLARFMEQGHFTVHLRRARAHYERCRDTLVETLIRHGGGRVTVDVPAQGVHLVAALGQGLSDRAVEATALARGIPLRPLSRTYLKAPPRQGLLLGFAGYEPAEIARAAKRLGETIGEVAAPPARIRRPAR